MGEETAKKGMYSLLNDPLFLLFVISFDGKLNYSRLWYYTTEEILGCYINSATNFFLRKNNLLNLDQI